MAIGLIFGTTLGVIARGWMRIISEDPEFSWEGTVFIVGIFTVWGFAQGTVIGVRSITSRRWIVTLVRVFGFLGMLPLFFAAGAIMAPTVIFGGLAIHRQAWRSIVRWLLAIGASVPVIVISVQIHGDFGWSWRLLIGIFLLLAIYGTVTMASQKTFAQQIDGWRVRRLLKIVSAFGVMLAISLPAIGLGFR
jgi:hypothetical protein